MVNAAISGGSISLLPIGRLCPLHLPSYLNQTAHWASAILRCHFKGFQKVTRVGALKEATTAANGEVPSTSGSCCGGISILSARNVNLMQPLAVGYHSHLLGTSPRIMSVAPFLFDHWM